MTILMGLGLSVLLTGCSGLAITDEDSGVVTTGKVVARVLLAIPTVGMSEVHLGFDARDRQRARDEAQYWRWVESLPPEQQERERDREARRDVARLQAWGLYMHSRPFQHAPVEAWRPVPGTGTGRSVGPLTCTTRGWGTTYATTTCD